MGVSALRSPSRTSCTDIEGDEYIFRVFHLTSSSGFSAKTIQVPPAECAICCAKLSGASILSPTMVEYWKGRVRSRVRGGVGEGVVVTEAVEFEVGPADGCVVELAGPVDFPGAQPARN